MTRAMFSSLCLLLALAAPMAEAAPRTLAAEVNTFIGSKDDGNTFPGASAPFGLIQVSPIGSHYSGWRYDDPQIRGFGHSFVSGAYCWEQGGQVSVLPVIGRIGRGGDFDTADPKAFDHKRYGSRYAHEGEVGQAGLLQGAPDRLRRHRRRGHRADPRRGRALHLLHRRRGPRAGQRGAGQRAPLGHRQRRRRGRRPRGGRQAGHQELLRRPPVHHLVPHRVRPLVQGVRHLGRGRRHHAARATAWRARPSPTAPG